MKTDIKLSIVIEETHYDEPSTWRLLGAIDKANNVVQICTRNNIKPKRLLEVGAGDGAILKNLGQQNFCPEMHALEISSSGVDVIQRQNITNLTSCQIFDGYSIPFPDQHFDIVILSHVLEHVEYERLLLREIRRVATRVVIEVPLERGKSLPECSKSLLPSYGHINVYTPDLFRFLLHTEQFIIDDHIFAQYSFDTISYNHFENSKRKKTPESVAQLKAQYNLQACKFRSSDDNEKSLIASSYCVLAHPASKNELQNIAVNNAIFLAETNIAAYANLILNFTFKENHKDNLLTIIKTCLQNGSYLAAEQFINEFQDRYGANEFITEAAKRIEDNTKKNDSR